MLLKELLDLNEEKKKKAKRKAKKVKEPELEPEDSDLEDQGLEDEKLKEEKWSGDVSTKWHPPEGFFKKSANQIASGLKNSSKDLKQAMSRLNFYINRSGKNLSGDDQDKLEAAKEKLHALYEKD